MSGNSKNSTIRERLTRVETLLRELKEGHTNHLRHHWQFNMVLLSAIAIEAVAFLVLVVKYVI